MDSTKDGVLQRQDVQRDDLSPLMSFKRRVLIAVGITVLVLAILWFLQQVITALLLGFAGILLAIFFRALTDWLRDHTPLSDNLAFAAIMLALVGGLALAVWLLAPRIAGQLDQLTTGMPQAVNQLRQRIVQYQWGQWLLDQAPQGSDILPSTGSVINRITSTFSLFTDVLVGVLVIFFMGLYLAINPEWYIGGLVMLFPPNRRNRTRAILNIISYNLWHWMLGQMISMITIGVLTGLGLWLLGVPAALTLGIIAGALEIIPSIGPVLALVPGVLIALMQSPTLALYTFFLYIGVQAFESYILTPNVMQRAASIPPALFLITAVALGALFGFLGLLVAAPLTLLVMVVVKTVYVEDTLGNTLDIPGEQK